MIDSLSIILPVFNEEKRLVKTFAHINKYLKKKTNQTTRIYFC